MKKLLCLLCFVVLSGSTFGQSAFSVIRKASGVAEKVPFKPIVISRTMTVPTPHAALARRVCSQRICTFKQDIPVKIIKDGVRLKQHYIEAQFAIARLNRPENVYGGYNYLRTLAKLSYKPQNIETAYQSAWNRINSSRSYNGAHHIVNKSTLREIYWDMKEKAQSRGEPFLINLSEMQNNAPAIFHRLHGDADFAHIFHNMERQLAIYYEYGVKEIIDDFFDHMSIISFESRGEIPPVPEYVRENTYLEAELWCKTFNLRWK